MHTLIIGLGNPLVTDDSVGLRVAAELRCCLAGRAGVEVAEDFWGGLRLMERMVGYERAIVIDAICSGAAPGTIHRLAIGDMPTQRSASSHDMTLPTALELGRQAGLQLPQDDDILILGIEAEDVVHFGETCTPAVAAAVPRAVEEVMAALSCFPELTKWNVGWVKRSATHRTIDYQRMVGCAALHPPYIKWRPTNMISPEILRRYPYFAGIDDNSLRQLAMLTEEKRRIPSGTRLFAEGEQVKHLGIILSGEVNIQYLLGNGEMRTVDTLVGGDLLGFSALIEPYKYTGFGTTTQPTDLAMIDAAKLRELCQQDPKLGFQLTLEVAKMLAHRLEGARVQLAAV
jgi:hydrogenase maturation protease